MRIVSHPPEQRVSIEQQAHRRLLPALKFFWRQRLKKLGAKVGLSLPRSWFVVAGFVLESHQHHHGRLAASNDDFLTLAGFLHEPRELLLGLVNSNCCHGGLY